MTPHLTLRPRQAQSLELGIVERAIREAEARGIKVDAAQLDPSQPGFITAAKAFGLDLEPPRHYTAWRDTCS